MRLNASIEAILMHVRFGGRFLLEQIKGFDGIPPREAWLFLYTELGDSFYEICVLWEKYTD